VKTIISVNGKPILERDYANALNGFALNEQGKKFSALPPLVQQDLQQRVQENLVARELLFEEAMARGIVPTNEETDVEIDKIVSTFPSPDAFASFLADAGISPMEYFRMTRQDLAVHQLYDRLRNELPEATAEAIAEFYQEHRDALQTVPKVHVRHILIRIEDDNRAAAQAKIEALRIKAQTDDFAELASLHSHCPSTVNGGSLGFISSSDVDPDFAAVAFTLQPGVVSDIVATAFGLHLLKVEERQEPRPLTLDEATPKICRMMTELALAQRLHLLIAALKGQAKIENTHKSTG